jgi:D-alanine-D-alanine ligase
LTCKESFMAHVGVIFGGRSVEHAVSIRSARTVVDGLRQAGHRVTPLGIAQDGCWIEPARSERVLADGEMVIPPVGAPIAPTLQHLIHSGVEVLFPIVHGTWGEDGTLQGLCEMLDLPYVGPGVTASALAMDKLLFKRQMQAAGVPVVDFEAVTRAEFESDPKACARRAERLPFPVFVKPSVGGSSVGIKKVDSPACLETSLGFALRFDETALVEKGIKGREIECAVLGYGTIEASVLGEIVPGNDFYDYADKYLQDTAKLIAPAELPEPVSDRLRAAAVAAFRAIGGAGLARVDFLVEGEDVYVNEINTLPGFTSISMYPRLWGLTGIPLPKLVDRLVQIAFERHRDRRRLDQGIKDFLAELAER